MEMEDISGELGCILPGDMMIEILTRLPVKSLVKFGCVKKSWYNLVKNSAFVKKHSLRVKGHSHIMSDIKCLNGKMESELLIVRPGSNKPENLGLSESGRVTIVGSSNGLVCLTYLDQWFGVRFKVMNPALGEHRYVHKTSSQLDQRRSLVDCMSVGFGCDEKSRDFKILRVEIVKTLNRGNWYNEVVYVTEVNLYSLRFDSWKKIQSPYGRWFKSSICTTTIGSCLYWLSPSRNGYNVITGFDLSSETFHEIPLPLPPKSRNLKCAQIAAWNHELLAAIFGKRENHGYDIWTVSPDQISIKHDSWKMQQTLTFSREHAIVRTPGLGVYYWPKGECDCIVYWEPIHVSPIPKITEYIKCCQICYYKETLEPILDAFKRKPVGASKQGRISKVLGGFLSIFSLKTLRGNEDFKEL